METFVCNKNGKIGHFKEQIYNGQEFFVLRNIRNECVLIVDEPRKPNIIAKETELRKYGTLFGTPRLGGV